MLPKNAVFFFSPKTKIRGKWSNSDLAFQDLSRTQRKLRWYLTSSWHRGAKKQFFGGCRSLKNDNGWRLSCLKWSIFEGFRLWGIMKNYPWKRSNNAKMFLNFEWLALLEKGLFGLIILLTWSGAGEKNWMLGIRYDFLCHDFPDHNVQIDFYDMICLNKL